MKATYKYNDRIIFHVESSTVKGLLTELAFYQSFPAVCPRCQADLIFTHRITKKKAIPYWELTCQGEERHRGQFHVYMENPDNIYWQWDEQFLSEAEVKALGNGDAAGTEDWEGSPAPPVQSQGQEPSLEEARELAIKELMKYAGLITSDYYAAWLAMIEEAKTVGSLRGILRSLQATVKKLKEATK